MNWEKANVVTYTLLRVVSGLLFIFTGASILFGWPGSFQQPLLSQAGIGGILQFFGGIMIMLGLFTSPVAFILSGMMAVAYWQFHFNAAVFPGGWFPNTNDGMPSVLLCFIFFYMWTNGAGPWSLDALIKSKRSGSK